MATIRKIKIKKNHRFITIYETLSLEEFKINLAKIKLRYTGIYEIKTSKSEVKPKPKDLCRLCNCKLNFDDETKLYSCPNCGGL